MSRGFSNDLKNALDSANVSLVLFAKLEFPSETIYVHNSIGTYTWGSKDWYGVGELGQISKVEEGPQVSPYSITLTLSGLDALSPDQVNAGDFQVGQKYVISEVGTTSFTAIGASSNTVGVTFTATGAGSGTGKANYKSGLLSTALTEDYYLQPVTIYMGVLDSDDALLEDPTKIWEGFMDQMNLSLGQSEGDAIQMICESELSRFDKSSNLLFSNASLQQKYTGDKFFNHLHKIEGAKVKWRGDSEAGSYPANPNSTPRTDGSEYD